MRARALEDLLTALPTLEEPVIACNEVFENTATTVDDAKMKLSYMNLIISECKDEIEKIKNDPKIKKFSEFHVLALSDFITDGSELFDQDERNALVLSK